jgi:hypothetical protein
MSRFVIINGFDRSGTSAISRTIASHLETELIMQPFNSGFIRREMYKVLDEEDKCSEVFRFFSDLEKNRLNNELIKSHWHFEHSSTLEFVPGKLHVIKTTINHLAQRWMKHNFPSIDVWGIWREPIDVVASIIRNGFYGEWYVNGIAEILPTIEKEEFLREVYWSFTDELNSEVKKTAFLLAVRSHFFMKYLDADKLLVYEEFRNNPSYLNMFTNHYGLAAKSFEESAKKDLNIIGQLMAEYKGYIFSTDDLEFMEKIFVPIQQLKARKFRV